MRLLPRDIKFYDQLLSQSKLIVQSATILRSALETGGPRIAEAARDLREQERKGDDLEHVVFERLHKTFITPIDPEDIYSISGALDRAMDSIEAIGYRVNAYGFSRVSERIKKLARVIEQCTGALNSVFEELNENGLEKGDSVMERCRRVNELEDEAQTLAREGVTEAFANEKDPIELMKLNAVYERFEKTGDRCEQVADLVANVLAKNS